MMTLCLQFEKTCVKWGCSFVFSFANVHHPRLPAQAGGRAIKRSLLRKEGNCVTILLAPRLR